MYEKKHPFPGLLINYDDGSYVVMMIQMMMILGILTGFPKCLNMALSGL